MATLIYQLYITEVRGAYLYLYDQTKDMFFYEHGDNCRKFVGKVSPTPFPLLEKGIFVPQNKRDLHFIPLKRR